MISRITGQDGSYLAESLAAPSHVEISFDPPEHTANTTGLGTLRLLEAVRQSAPECRFFLAVTSEIFGDRLESPQTDRTRSRP